MFSQLKEEFCNIGGKGFRTIPVKDCNGRAGVDDGVPKMNLGGGEVENGGNTEGNETKGLEVREQSPLKVVVSTDEKRRGGETCVEGREWPIIWTMN